jgi:predicted aspartyl protease/Flp pilus assembly protein TadD
MIQSFSEGLSSGKALTMNPLDAKGRQLHIVIGILFSLVICLACSGPVFGAAADNKKARQKADKALRAGDYEVAEKIFRELITKDAHDNGARLGLSLALLKQRLLRDAYDQAARVVLADPLSARGHALLGSVILASGDFHNSVEEFRTALSIEPNEALAIGGLAMVEFYENRLESAVRGLRRAVALDSAEPDYVFNLGQASARSERYKEAADSYERFLTIAPKADADRRARIRGLIDFLRYLGRQGTLYVPAGGNKANLSFDAVDGRPVLKVRINNGKELFRFVLDTGSGMTVISEETAKKLGVSPVARGGLARAVGGGGKFEIVYGFLSALELGEVRLESVPVYIRHFYQDKAPVDGYIGLSVISKFITSLDYGERTFTLRRKTDPASGANFPEAMATAGPGTVEIPLRTTSSGFLSGEVRLEGIERPQNFIIDTGASISVVSEKLVETGELGGYLQPTRMRVFGAAGIAEDVKSVLLPKVMIGTFAREQISAAVLDMESLNETAGFTQDGILGGNFLKHFRVSFDFQQGLIRLEPLRKTTKSEEPVAPDR